MIPPVKSRKSPNSARRKAVVVQGSKRALLASVRGERVRNGVLHYPALFEEATGCFAAGVRRTVASLYRIRARGRLDSFTPARELARGGPRSVRQRAVLMSTLGRPVPTSPDRHPPRRRARARRARSTGRRQ